MERKKQMEVDYRPQGTCSYLMHVAVEDGIVTKVEVEGGCNGNLQGISRLVVGMKAQEAIEKMEGIKCGFRPTSCPDQLSKALKKCLETA